MKGKMSGSLAALVVLGLALSLIGCSGTEATGKPGDPISAGDYQLTVTKVEPRADPPDRFTNPKPGNRFAKFDFVVLNTGNQHLPVAASYFSMRDSGNLDYPPREGITSDTILKQTSLSPGQRVQASLYFEMAGNQNPVELTFAPAVVGWRTKIHVDLQ